MSRRVSSLIALTFVAALFVPDAAAAAPCWVPPLTGVVTDPFREPSCPYCAGNRGIEYRVRSGTVVRAVDSGVVSWAGTIAGTTYVVVRHRNGWRVTYGRLATASLRAGDTVLAGTAVGRTSGSFYFGLRVGQDYVDPAPFLGERRGRPRLVPVDGRAARPAPAPRWRCGV